MVHINKLQTHRVYIRYAGSAEQNADMQRNEKCEHLRGMKKMLKRTRAQCEIQDKMKSTAHLDSVSVFSIISHNRFL